MRRCRLAQPQIAMDRLEKWGARRNAAHRKVRVHDVGIFGHERSEIERRIVQLLGGQFLHRGFGDLRPRLREQRDAVPQLGEPAHERHDDPLGSTVALHRQAVMRHYGDVHRGHSITSFVACASPG